MRCLAVPLALATAITVIGVVAIGCGPSIRRVHRSRVYFERCYAADLDARVPVEERRACWQQWIAHYQIGQPPDRIDYVRERILRLDPERAEIVAMATAGEGEPGDEPDIAAEARLVAATVSGAEPEPEREIEPEPEPQPEPQREPEPEPEPEIAVIEPTEPVAARPVGEAPEAPSTIPSARARRAARTPPIPRSDSPHCAEACRPIWESCLAGCADLEGSPGADVASCQRSCRLRHRLCARGCY